jgi:AcrR family transcriptional regulator
VVAPERKREILTAAGTCFAKFGYEKTTLDDIGEMVGLNKVSLYHYFASKEAIFVELITMEADQYGDSLKSKVKSITQCKPKILAWIKEGFKYNEANSILRQFSIESLKRLTPQLEELKNYSMNKGTEYFSSILKQAQKKNEVVPCDADKVAHTIQNMIYSMKDYAYQRARTNPHYRVDVDELANEVLFAVSLVLDGILHKQSR